MKVLKYFSMLFIITIVVISCSKEDDYKKFMEGGEIVYAGMLDSVFAQSGKERINLQMYLGQDASVTKIKVYWNDGEDSSQVDIARPVESNEVNLLIPNLPVGSYNFKLYTYDSHNNSSVAKNFSGVSYGDDFENTMVNRRIASIKQNKTADSLLFNWVTLSPGLVKTDLTYTKADGEVVTITIPAKETVTKLENDYLVGSTVSYQSTFKFNEKAFDSYVVPEPSTFVLNELTSYPK